MNKKAYIIPVLRTTTLGVETLIANSITGTSGANGLGAGGDTETANITSGNVKGNSYNVWDDDWSK